MYFNGCKNIKKDTKIQVKYGRFFQRILIAQCEVPLQISGIETSS